MKVYLVQAAGDVTGSAGYGKAILDCAFPNILTSFADQTYRRRNTLFPPDDHPIWDQQYDPVAKIASQAPRTTARIGLQGEPQEKPADAVLRGPRRQVE